MSLDTKLRPLVSVCMCIYEYLFIFRMYMQYGKHLQKLQIKNQLKRKEA